MKIIEYIDKDLNEVIPKGIINYQNASDETLANKGYYRVIIPTFDEDTQKLENLHIAGNIATYDVVDIPITEVEAKKERELKAEIERVFGRVLKGAMAILMGKTLDDDLDYYREVYKTKYEYCKDPNNTYDSLLQLEFSNESIPNINTLQEYKQFVITRYEQAEAMFKNVQAMLEVLRKKILKDISDKIFEKGKERLDALDNLDISLSPAQFQGEFQRILSL